MVFASFSLYLLWKTCPSVQAFRTPEVVHLCPPAYHFHAYPSLRLSFKGPMKRTFTRDGLWSPGCFGYPSMF
jgi:hypothetical protein